MSIQFEKDDQNIVTLSMDMPGRSQNVLNDEFESALSAAVERILGDSSVSGVIITSKKKTFMAGADLDKIYGATDPIPVFQWVERFKAILRSLETCGKPVVAAINGTVLGGGYELTLACHRRIAINHPKTKIGLPEIKLGLFPGGGATQRLPRMIGIQRALPFLLEGTELNPEEALQQGLIDELAENETDLMAKSRQWILKNPQVCQPWDDKKFRWPGGDNSNPANAQMWTAAPAMLNQKTRGNYPAAQHILSCVYEGASVDLDTGCRIESRYFANTATSKTAKNMITAFWYQMNQINKGVNRPGGFEPTAVKKVGILGAGMMGSGIALVSAKAGIETVLKDVSLELAQKGKGYSEDLFEKQVSKGRMTPEKKNEILNRIQATGKAADLKGCDLIIEAVFEDRELKAKVTAETEAQIEENAVFASNTSTLPITGLAKRSTRPKNFIGLHFFSPVDKMQLVEIIVGKETSDETLARAFDYVVQIRKTPIVVNDSRGFYTSRVFCTYPLEGIALLVEGQHPRAIESAGIQAGMPVGPLAVIDEVSLSLILHIEKQTEKDLIAEGKPYNPHPSVEVIRKMVEDFDRPGKKAGKGFYEYPAHEKKYLWKDLQTHFPPAKKELSQEDMIIHLMFPQALETVRCLEEKVLRGVADANLGSIFGWGFPPFKGGVLQSINDYGLPEFVTKSQELAKKYGLRFNPPETLVRMARDGETFY